MEINTEYIKITDLQAQVKNKIEIYFLLLMPSQNQNRKYKPIQKAMKYKYNNIYYF